MTDTPRTKAELQAIFADGQVGEITAQDMRDQLESFTDPVDGFPLGGEIWKKRFAEVTMYQGGSTIATIPASAAVSYGVSQIVPFTTRNATVADHEGWTFNSYTQAPDDPNTAWGADITAGSVALLPPGIYSCFAVVGWYPSTFAYGGGRYPVECLFDQMSYTVGAFPPDDSDAYIWDCYLGPVEYTLGAYRNASGEFNGAWGRTTLVNDTDEAKPYGLMAYTIDHTSDVLLSSASVYIVKL